MKRSKVDEVDIFSPATPFLLAFPKSEISDSAGRGPYLQVKMEPKGRIEYSLKTI